MSNVDYRLLLLGPSSLTPTDPNGASLPPGKPLAMLAYLACAPGQSASRERLIDLLWADAERDSARHTLRQTLWYVRRRVGGAPFETSGDTVRLVMPLASDRAEFVEAFDAGNWEAAFERYSGAFFPGFAATGGAQFEQWADLERQRLQALFERAAESFLGEALIERSPREVVPLARRARELAPDSPVVWRLLLQALLAANDQFGAAAEADQLEQWLAREELTPDGATRAILKLVRSGDGRDAAHAEEALVAELVGRERSLSLLLQRWEQARGGAAGHVHVMARAGLGKTRLLDDFARRLRLTRARTVSVRAIQAHRDLPFSLAADLTLALSKLRGAAGVSPDSASALVALAPGVSTYLSAPADRTVGSDALRRRSLAVQELVAAVADDAPLVILVDDMHWSDSASRAILASVSASLRSARVLMVSAGRQALGGVGEHVHQFPLEPLTEEQVTLLLESLAALPADPVEVPWSRQLAAQLHAAADGSPLLVLETVSLALERGLLTMADGRWHCPDPNALVQMLGGGSAIRQRLLDVPLEQLGTLILLTVLGSELDERALRSVLGNDGAAALPLLEARGLITRQETGWLVSHDEIAARIRDHATPAQLTAAHRQSATVLQASPMESPSVLLRAARHRHEAGDQSELQQLFARLVRASAADGDRRAIRALALQVLGAHAPAAECDALIAALPWRVRASMPRLFGGGVAALAAMLLLVAALVPERSVAEPTGDVSFLVAARVGNDTVMYGAELAAGLLGGGRELTLREVPVTARGLRELLKLTSVHARWGDTVVGPTLAYGSAYGIELMQVDLATGNSVRLTESAGDDYGFALSPDRTQAAFASARADLVNEFSNLYVMNRADGSVKRLTSASHWDGLPAWSPDGERIAFFRRYSTVQPNTVCWLELRSGTEACLAPPAEYELKGSLTWDSHNTLLVLAEPMQVTASQLLRVDVATGAVEPLRGVVDLTLVEPGGEFGIEVRSQPGQLKQSAVMFALSAPEQEVQLRFPDPGAVPLFRSMMWSRRRAAELFRGTLDLLQPPDTIRADALTQLRVVAHGRDGHRTNAEAVQFTSLDRSVADVSAEGGVVAPYRAGAVQVVVSAAGFRPDTVTLQVGPARFGDDVLTEDWRTLDLARWVPWGTPPVEQLSTGDGGYGLQLSGDGHLFSGVYQRRAVEARAGLGVEVRVKAPVNSSHWQSIHVELSAVASDDAVAQWAEGTASAEEQPHEWAGGVTLRSCRLGLPRSEGGALVDQVSFDVAGYPTGIKRLPQRITDGAWHTVRLQLFADGRCGLAVDGRVITISERAMPRDQPLRLGLSGQSVGTQMLVGSLSMWRGERLDLPWFAVLEDTPDER